MSLLGIDVGTTGCKAAVFSKEGRLLASAYEEYDNLRPRLGWGLRERRFVSFTLKGFCRPFARGRTRDRYANLNPKHTARHIRSRTFPTTFGTRS